MIVTTRGLSVGRTSWQKKLKLTCPACNAYGTFDFVAGIAGQTEIIIEDGSVVGTTPLYNGTRQCPDASCGCIVSFWMYENNYDSLVTWPTAKAAFDPQYVPSKVQEAFREALQCAANGLYVASAILLRKTMEEICGEQSASGSNLQEKIDSLLSQGNISSKLTDTLHEIRYLGNDAAHLTAKVFHRVGKDECTVAIKILRETIRQLYQTGHLKGEIDSLKL